jgi:peptide/nickel transport system ATP-binding protein
VNAPHSATSLGLEVSGLRVEYDGFVAVADTSFTVSPGESFGIVGESGSGKSTVLRAICGLAPRTAGTVKLLGQDSAPGSKAFRRQVQMVFQDPVWLAAPAPHGRPHPGRAAGHPRHS